MEDKYAAARSGIVGRRASSNLVQFCCAAGLSCSGGDRVSTNSALYLPVGCCTAQGSRRSGQLVAPTCRIALLSGIPVIWLCLRGLFSRRLSTPTGRRLIWTAVALSICGTISVTVPFLLRLGNHRVAHASGDCLDLCQASESIEIKNRRIRRAQILKRLIDAFYLPTTDPQHRQDCKRRVVGDDGQSGSTP